MKQWTLVLGAMIAAASFACSDSNSNDSGGGGADAGGFTDAVEQNDATVDAGRVDTGIPRTDSGVVDGGEHFCATGDRITVEGAEVVVGMASTPAQRADNSNADLSCIDDPPTQDIFSAPIYMRGCFTATGDMLTPEEISKLRIDVFVARDVAMNATDPSYDFVTGRDRDPGARQQVEANFDPNVSPTLCPSHLQVDIGFDAPGQALGSEVEYIVRVRTSTGAATPVIVPTYFFGVIVRNDQIVGAPLDLQNCTSQQCSLRFDFNVVRATDLATAIAAAQNPIPGSADLTDGLGSGYGMIQTFDCTHLPIAHAVAGFNPAPLNDGYIDNGVNYNATESTGEGLYVAVGFPGQAATASTAIQVVGAIGAKRDDTCTEEFGGRKLTIFPDSISVIRSSAETVLHGP